MAKIEMTSKLQKLLPYDWRIVNKLDRDITADEYAVSISWISFINWTMAFRSRNDMKEIVKAMASISKDAKLDFCHFFGLGNEEIGTIYINKTHGQLDRDIRKAKQAKKFIPELQGVD